MNCCTYELNLSMLIPASPPSDNLSPQVREVATSPGGGCCTLYTHLHGNAFANEIRIAILALL